MFLGLTCFKPQTERCCWIMSYQFFRECEPAMLLRVNWFSSTEKATLGLNCFEAVMIIEPFVQFQYCRNRGCLPWRIPYVKCGSANTCHSSIQGGEVESVFIKCIIIYLVILPVLYNQSRCVTRQRI